MPYRRFLPFSKPALQRFSGACLGCLVPAAGRGLPVRKMREFLNFQQRNICLRGDRLYRIHTAPYSRQNASTLSFGSARIPDHDGNFPLYAGWNTFALHRAHFSGFHVGYRLKKLSACKEARIARKHSISTSVQIWISAGPIAMPTMEAVRSEPPRPSPFTESRRVR
jgi:hypothetical protein